MSRARLTLFALLFASAVSAAIVGGIFQISLDLIGPPGSPAARGGAFDLRQVAGQAAVTRMTGGAFDLQSGYLGGTRDADLVAGVDDDNLHQSRFDVVEGHFLGYHPGQPFEFTFSHAMNTASFDRGIVLEEMESPVGVALAAPAAVALVFTYNAGTHHVSCAPASGELAYNAAYRLTLSTDVLDESDTPLPQASVFGFSTLAHQSEDSSLVAADQRTKVAVPAGAAAADFYAVLRVDPLNHPERMDVASYQQATQKAETSYDGWSKPVSGAVREFTAYDGANQLITHFDKPVTLEIPFQDADHDGVVDGTVPPVRAESLAVWWLDEAKKLWVRLPNPKVDLARGVVSAETVHFSAFALIGAADTNVDQVRVYPIPFRPNAGDPARFGLASEGVHFDNLPDSAEITIYTLTGRKVKSIAHSGVAEERWLGDNDGGQRVASGVYRYVIKSGSNKKIGRLMVIW